MTVIELIEKLQTMPQNSLIYCGTEDGYFIKSPNPSQEWDDDSENYVVIL